MLCETATHRKHPQPFAGCGCKTLKFNEKIEKWPESLCELESYGLEDSGRSLVSLKGTKLLKDRITKRLVPKAVTCSVCMFIKIIHLGACLTSGMHEKPLDGTLQMLTSMLCEFHVKENK